MDTRRFSWLVMLPTCFAIFTHLFWNRKTPSLPGDADVIFRHATIYTGDSGVPWATALAVRKGRILEIGSYEVVKAHTGPSTIYEDLNGSFVVPGFIDSHLHLIPGGLQMLQINLQDTHSKHEFIQTVQLAVRGMKSGQWVLGGGWNHEKWGGELPTASWINSFTSDVPVWLYRMDGHMGLANSEALRVSGVGESTEEPEGGTIMKDENGGLSGILVDSATKLVVGCIPEATAQERLDALARASMEALSQGITAVVDFGRFYPGMPTTKVWDDFHDVYKWSDQKGTLVLRVCVFFPLETWSDVDKLVKQTGKKLSQNLRVGGVKAFADGSLGSGTALFNEPYADNLDNFGLEMASPETIMKHALQADKRGLQVAIHAIGDAANDRILDVYRTIKQSNGLRDRRLRIEHAQHLSKKALEIFGTEGIIASMQPEQLLDDAVFASRKLGEERALRESYLFNSLRARNTTLAFGSDWPVVRLSPLRGLLAATQRTPTGWSSPWIPSECIDVETALRGYTSAAAFASFMDDDIGSLSRGKFADFAVLSGNVLENDGQAISVLATYKGGVKVFSKE